MDDPVKCSDYLNLVNRKRNRNKRKLQDLGLMEKTPTPKSRSITPKSTSTSRKSPRINEEKNNARRKIMQSPISSSEEKKSPTKEEKCPFDHKCFSANYNEEQDK